jgi:hypothetical protein
MDYEDTFNSLIEKIYLELKQKPEDEELLHIRRNLVQAKNYFLDNFTAE